MKTTGSENQNPLRNNVQQTEYLERKVGTSAAQSCGLESKKTSGHARRIFLDFSLCELTKSKPDARESTKKPPHS
jgi:hypothetical protein